MVILHRDIAAAFDKDLNGVDEVIHDVKFWPYGTSSDDQVFALTGATDVSILWLLIAYIC